MPALPRVALPWALSALVAALCACGGDLCDREAASFDRAKRNAGGCPDVTLGITYDRAACESQLSRCSQEDLGKVSAYLDCLDALPFCSPGIQRSVFVAEFNKCATAVGKLSPGCGGT